MIKIKIINSRTPTELKELDLAPETMLNKECLIGRFPNCGLVLDSSEVSRMHGKIFYQDGNYYFADLGSSGGSWLNTENVKINQPYFLKVNDIIRVGGFVLMIVAVGSSVDAPTLVITTVKQERTQIDGTNNGHQNISEPPQITPPASPNEYMPVATVDPNQIQRWTKGDLAVRCIRVIDETVDAKTFCFVANPPMLFTYKPGQFVTLNLEINGEEVSRSYSISSTPSRPHTLEITVKQVPPPPDGAPETPRGSVSHWLHENVKAGSEIKLNGPMGKFHCFANPSQKLLLISAGSGITPMMSMSRWLVDTASECDIVFLHSARSPRDIIFRQELELMSARYPNFHLAVTTTRQEPGQSWLGLTGRLNAAMLQLVVPNFRERTVYVCGPNQFMQGVKEMLESLDFPMQNYYEESFGPPPKPPKPSQKLKEESSSNESKRTHGGLQSWLRKLPNDPLPAKQGEVGSVITPVPVNSPIPIASASTSSKLAVVFAKSGKEIDCDGEDPILNLAEQEGVKIRSSCRSGSCGSCKKRKLEGEIKYSAEPEGLEEEERQEYILTCISYPVGRVVIDA